MKEKQIEQRKKVIKPLYQVAEEKGKVIVRLEMPGVKKDNLEIKVENNELKVLGKRCESKKEAGYLIKERRGGDFEQIFTLDNTIDQDKIDAQLNNGVLVITLSLKESEKPRLIKVKTA